MANCAEHKEPGQPGALGLAASLSGMHIYDLLRYLGLCTEYPDDTWRLSLTCVGWGRVVAHTISTRLAMLQRCYRHLGCNSEILLKFRRNRLSENLKLLFNQHLKRVLKHTGWSSGWKIPLTGGLSLSMCGLFSEKFNPLRFLSMALWIVIDETPVLGPPGPHHADSTAY